MKKRYILLVGIFVFLFGFNSVRASDYCTKENAMQLAKIVYHETGADSAVNSDENFFMRLTTAAVVINNANNKSGNTFYDKLYNLTDSNYQNYSTYKDKSFENVVTSSKQGEMLYIAEIVLSGKYTLPKNMKLQASQEIVEKYGTVWGYVDNFSGFYDIYFGYEGSSLNTTDIYGNSISNTSFSDYKSKANNFKLSSYSNYSVDTVCSGISNNNGSGVGSGNDNGFNNSNDSENNSVAFDTCTNPDILKVIYFCILLIDIVKIIVPIGLIIMGMIDFSKSVTTNDEGIQKKNLSLFVKRVVYAVLIFIIPWIVKVLIVNLGDLTEGVNYTDCIENANSETIEAIENGTYSYSD